MKTIKQIADSLGIEKQRVYRFIKANHIMEAHQKRSVMYYDEATEIKITKHFNELSALQEAHQTASLETVIELLKSELEVKNLQIHSLNEQNKALTLTLQTAQQSLTAAQALHVGTMTKHITDTEAVAPKEGFFARFFGRRR